MIFEVAEKFGFSRPGEFLRKGSEQNRHFNPRASPNPDQSVGDSVANEVVANFLPQTALGLADLENSSFAVVPTIWLALKDLVHPRTVRHLAFDRVLLERYLA